MGFLSDHDAEWSRDGIDWDVDNEAFRKQYFDLNKTFNPIRLEPEKWADLAAEAGFKYLIFTTKHHDGFCMWDTKYSDYKTTAPDCPFHTRVFLGKAVLLWVLLFHLNMKILINLRVKLLIY